MSRHQPSGHVDLPRIVPRPLSQAYDWAALLGWDALPAATAANIADFATRMPVTQRIMAGFTAGKAVAELNHISRELRRDGRRGWRASEARQRLADPGTLPIVFHERLAPLTGQPADALCKALGTVAREIAALPRTNAQWEHTKLTAACALGMYWMAANPASRSPEAAWEFALAIMDSGALPTTGLRRNPGRLKEFLGPVLTLMQPG